MQKNRLLREIGLSAYESAVYLSLLKLGSSEARVIHKDAEVPYGKIYDILDSLVERGFVEVQRSRPKKFRGVKPDIALDRFFKKREFDIENELEALKLKIEELNKILISTPSLKTKDEIFWTTAVTEADIKKVVISLFSEAKESLCTIPHSLGMPILATLFAEFVRSLERGVKIKMLISPQFNNFVSFLERKDGQTVEILKEKLEIRKVKNTSSYFGIIDDNVVILLQPHPLERDRLISVVKIWDTELAKNLKKEFEMMWKVGKKFTLDEKMKND
jgi:HTH-type transcriptional regulator, sugar sensing transcriptional regulator